LDVGKIWQWTEYEAWTKELWRGRSDRKEYQTWMLLYLGTPAVYFELNTEGRDVERAYFGLLSPLVGKRLGGGLLSAAIENAWGEETNWVWINTSSLDHSYMLKNY